MANTRECPNCYKQISNRANHCSYCGQPVSMLVEERTKEKTNPLLLIIAAAVSLFLLYYAYGAFVDYQERRSLEALYEQVQSMDFEVEYRVTGTGRTGDVTYENGDGGTSQEDIRIPWDKEVTMGFGDFVYVSTQSGDDASRTITCEIYVNGQLYKKSTSDGRYVIASCSGSVGGD